VKRFTKEQFKIMPWKNGGGETTELIKLGDFDFRISIARVERDGPFSIFSMIDRILLILQGAGCELKMKNQSIELNTHTQPFHFAGEEEINCTLLNGALIDFNVMVNRNWGEATVQRNPILFTESCESDWLYIYYPGSNQLIELSKQETYKLEESEAICVWVNKKAG
jgi:environmental stress-induced protein Ves